MSLFNSKTFLAGVLLAISFAMTGSAEALEGARFWKPYQPEEFGGQRRDGDGLYGAITAIYWKVDGPKNTWVGYTNSDGSNGSRLAYDGNKTFMQSNSMNMNNGSADFTLGTRVELGNYRGHHGWLFSGYGLSDSGYSFSSRNGSMVIKDSETLTSYAIYGSTMGWNEVWQPNGTFKSYPRSASGMTSLPDGIPQVPIRNVGYLWAWFPVHWSDPWIEGRLAPAPINFDRATVTNSANITSLELMYTYRPHPFKWGGMELLAGARYWEFDDEMRFLGQGYAEAYVDYDETIIDDDDNNNNNNNNNNNGGGSQTDESITGQTNSNADGALTILADTTISGRAQNRIVGPQIGVKFNRRNQRWTFGAEGRFMAGINTQTHRVSGTLGTHFINTANVPQIDSATVQEHGVLPYMPIGLHHNTQTFYHHQNKTYFSPGLELRLSAKWQWTDNVGIQFGFDSTIFDNIARGAKLVDYSIAEDGTLFGIRTGSQNSTVIVYGFNIGLNIRR